MDQLTGQKTLVKTGGGQLTGWKDQDRTCVDQLIREGRQFVSQLAGGVDVSRPVDGGAGMDAGQLTRG